MLDTILSIQPKESASGGGETREQSVQRQAKDMLSKLPKDYDPFEVKERLKIMGILSSMNIFLRQEIDRMQKVITTVRKTLKDLLLAIDGTIIMNEVKIIFFFLQIVRELFIINFPVVEKCFG